MPEGMFEILSDAVRREAYRRNVFGWHKSKAHAVFQNMLGSMTLEYGEPKALDEALGKVWYAAREASISNPWNME